ncbi:MAG: hypothetical protein ACE5J3_09600 [Methanosarcinales archaeon]
MKLLDRKETHQKRRPWFRREKCPHCTRGLDNNEHVTMNRLYVKFKKSWRIVGWICLSCRFIKLEEDIPIKRYLKYDKYYTTPKQYNQVQNNQYT